MTQRRAQWVRVAASVAAVALIVAACDSGDGGDSSSDTTTTTADPNGGLTGEPIKLMVIFEGTGISAIPSTPEGAIAAATAINQDGGIDGRPLEVVPCDTGNDPNTAAECGRQMVDDGFVAAVGSLSIQTSEYLPQMVEAKIPSVGQAPTTADTFTSEASFPIQGAAVTSIAGLAAALAEAGSTNIAVVRPDLAAAAAIAGFADSGLERFGQTVGNDVPVPEAAPDMAPSVQAALDGGTDGVLIGLAGPEATAFYEELRVSDPDIPVALVTTLDDEVFDALGDLVNGLIQQSQFLGVDDSDAPAVQDFADDMEAAGFETSGARRPNSWTSVQVVADGLREATEISGPALWDVLDSGREFVTGLTPPVQFTVPGPLPRIFNTCLIIEVVEDGAPQPVTGEFVDAITGELCVQP